MSVAKLCDDVTILRPLRVRWAGHLRRTILYHPKSNGMRVGRRPVGKSRDRWDDAVGRDAVDLLQIREVGGSSTKRKVGVFGVRGGQAMVRKRAETPWEEEEEKKKKGKKKSVAKFI